MRLTPGTSGLALLGWVLLSSTAVGQSTGAGVSKPSFDCRKTTTATEKAICGAPELGQLDLRISEAFRKARSLANLYLRKQLLDEQQTWLKERNECKSSVECLGAAMQKRLEGLVAFTNEYEHPREERHGPFSVRYVRGKQWDIVAPVIVSGPAGLDTTRLAETLQGVLAEGCDTEDSASFALRSEVLHADERFFTVRTSYDYYCGGAYPSAHSFTRSYAVATGEALEFSKTFQGGLTVGRVLELATKHAPAFSMPDGDCAEEIQNPDSAGEWSIGVVGSSVVFSRTFPHVSAACDFEVKLPLVTVAPFIAATGPLAPFVRHSIRRAFMTARAEAARAAAACLAGRRAPDRR